MKATRGLMAAAVFASAVWAGIIASSSGSAIAAPAPCSTVRRERCFFVMNMVWSPALRSGRNDGSGRSFGSVGSYLCGPRDRGRRRRRAPPEGIAVHDAEHDGLEAVVLGLGVAHDVAHGGHVVEVDVATHRVDHQLLGDGLRQLVTADS